MKKIKVGLIGLGTVGAGVAKLIKTRHAYVKAKFNVDLELKTICDLKIDPKLRKSLATVKATSNFHEILNDPDIDVVVELIGGLHPAYEIISGALNKDKHVVTANKAVISNYGRELFRLAHEKKRSVYFESAVLAGVPIIKTLTEGIAGNQFTGLYGIVNGTCNFILTEMSTNGLSFESSVKLAQDKGYAESDPTLDINGMDSAHKLAVLIALAMGKFLKVKEDIYTEGITHISAEDLAYADQMGLTIKLLAIAKKNNNKIEARVHPTLISKKHPLASVNNVYNAVLLDADALGDVLLVGQGAGQMAAASGVFSDLINLAIDNETGPRTWIGDNPNEIEKIALRSMDEIETEFYIRLMVLDRPGVLSKITGILGQCGISIASVTQKAVNKNSFVPLVMLTHVAKESSVKKALQKINQLKEVAAKPVAIRMEQL
ncbi:MAG: homoserine dehydrogenase [Candidatus Omnitrophica bacterium]|nr:homoserine dehydrogenase [Candidatus Omnitrophota bacterium]